MFRRKKKMTEAVFVAEPSRLLIAAAVGIVLLLLLIIKFKIHPVLSLLISALFIGLGAGMPVPTLVSTVEKGAGETLQGIVLLIGLGSLFGGILEVSGGAQCVAQTLVNEDFSKNLISIRPDRHYTRTKRRLAGKYSNTHKRSY